MSIKNPEISVLGPWSLAFGHDSFIWQAAPGTLISWQLNIASEDGFIAYVTKLSVSPGFSFDDSHDYILSDLLTTTGNIYESARDIGRPL